MRFKTNFKNKRFLDSLVIIVISLSFYGCALFIQPETEYPGKLKIQIVEKTYSDDSNKISIGIANRTNMVGSSSFRVGLIS